MTHSAYGCGCLLCAGKTKAFIASTDSADSSAFGDAASHSLSAAADATLAAGAPSSLSASAAPAPSAMAPAPGPLAASSSSLPPAPAQPVVAFPFTGDYRIDTLLQDPSYRWNGAAPMGTVVNVTYSFMTVKPSYGGTDDGDGDRGFTPFTTQQMAAVRQIFAKLQTEIGITFTEVSDSSSSYGQIRFGDNRQDASSGYAYLPGSTGSALDGDVWIDISGSDAVNATSVTPGTFGYATLVHEIGHSLGLKHPGNYNAGSTSSSSTPGNYLGVLEDNTNYTVMSYRDPSGGQERDWYGMYDLLTLKKLYGARAINAGNNTYSYNDASGTVLGIIDDSGGTDTIDVSGSSVAARVDMRAGAFSSVGLNGRTAAVNNLSIELTTTIENFIGTAQGDTVTGNAANNLFNLGAGANVADGGAGIDMALYASVRAAYKVTVSSASVITVTAPGISDTLTNVERLSFANTRVAFDLGATGNAGITAKIIGAVFGSAALARTDYVAIGLAQLDGGTSYNDLVTLALNAALGPGFTNTAEIQLLYKNVTGITASADTINYYSSAMNAGTYTQVSLGVLAAETPENANSINLVGLASTGIAYG